MPQAISLGLSLVLYFRPDMTSGQIVGKMGTQKLLNVRLYVPRQQQHDVAAHHLRALDQEAKNRLPVPLQEKF